jgi:predicted amidohydrolase YtcJ
MVSSRRADRQSGLTHSITHLRVANSKEFDRFKSLNVIASMQMYWASADESEHWLAQTLL